MNKENSIIYSGEYTFLSREKLIKKIKKCMSKERFEHVLSVERTALDLARKYNFELEKTSIAALLHDIAKERSDEEMRDIVISENLDLDMLGFGSAIWHGPVGAVLVKREFGIVDAEILDAITYHTFGSPQMDLLSKIIFVADYIEPRRDFDAVIKARKIADDSLDEAIQYIMKQTINYLILNNQLIYPRSIDTYNYWIKQKEIIN